MRKTLLALSFLLLLGQLNAQNKDLTISSVFGGDSRVFVEQGILYERLGLKYYFGESDRFYAGLFVKAHASVDYIEWTLGMHLFQSKSDAKQHYL